MASRTIACKHPNFPSLNQLENFSHQEAVANTKLALNQTGDVFYFLKIVGTIQILREFARSGEIKRSDFQTEVEVIYQQMTWQAVHFEMLEYMQQFISDFKYGFIKTALAYLEGEDSQTIARLMPLVWHSNLFTEYTKDFMRQNVIEKKRKNQEEAQALRVLLTGEDSQHTSGEDSVAEDRANQTQQEQALDSYDSAFSMVRQQC